MMVSPMAQTAQKGLIERLHLKLLLQPRADVLWRLLGSSRPLLFLHKLTVDVHPLVEGVPNAAELSDWPKDGSLELVKIMVESVTALDEV